MAEAVGFYKHFSVYPISGFEEWVNDSKEGAQMKAGAYFGNKHNSKEYEVSIDSHPADRERWIFQFTKGFDKLSDNKEIAKVLSTMSKIVEHFSVSPPMGDLGQNDIESMCIKIKKTDKNKDLLKAFYNTLEIEDFEKDLDERPDKILIELEEK